MNALIGNGVVLLALAAVAGLAIRSLWKSRRAGGRCTGNCAACGGCRGGRIRKPAQNQSRQRR